jgi:hypothetical protein
LHFADYRGTGYRLKGSDSRVQAAGEGCRFQGHKLQVEGCRLQGKKYKVKGLDYMDESCKLKNVGYTIQVAG